MTDETGQYTIVFNGEFYNYRIYRNILEKEGVRFYTQSDTEVLLNLYIKYGLNCLEKLNGFFAFAIWDNWNRSILIARDRMGIKPLLWSVDEKSLSFASEMKAMLALGVEQKMDQASLFTYLQLNYIPAPSTIFEKVNKLLPGHHIFIENIDNCDFEEIQTSSYYEIPTSSFNYTDLNPFNYATASETLVELLDEAVQKRLVADVELGTFLSGGIDSSIITALASRQVSGLKTFSIGFSGEEYYDETEYARSVARKFRTEHTEFFLTEDSFFDHIEEGLEYLDEPFGDSAFMNFFMLSKFVGDRIKVALSGDGADELFGGYQKHFAEYQIRQSGVGGTLLKAASPMIDLLPQGKDNRIQNLGRQLSKFKRGLQLSNKERYWAWASTANEEQANYLLRESNAEREQRLSDDAYSYKKRKEFILSKISKAGNLNEVLYTDMKLVLPNDMLFKVDMASMANSLEVRTPFLDYHIVDFAFQIPHEFKVNQRMRKKIVQDAFRNILPEELYNRPKKGFEVPVGKWLKDPRGTEILERYLNEDKIIAQGIFNPSAVNNLRNNSGGKETQGEVATLWSLLVFQKWYDNYVEA